MIGIKFLHCPYGLLAVHNASNIYSLRQNGYCIHALIDQGKKLFIILIITLINQVKKLFILLITIGCIIFQIVLIMEYSQLNFINIQN